MSGRPTAADLAARVAAAELDLSRRFPPRVARAAVRRALGTAAQSVSPLPEGEQMPAALAILERELGGAERWARGVVGQPPPAVAPASRGRPR